MPLMSEFPRYRSWERSAKRWKNLLHNHPVSNVIEYFINNLRDSHHPLDRGTGDFLKNHFRKKIEVNEELLNKGEPFEMIGYEWMFRALKDKYEERPGEAIKRITNQLETTNRAIYHELEDGVQDPEGAWEWLSKKRDGLDSLGGKFN